MLLRIALSPHPTTFRKQSQSPDLPLYQCADAPTFGHEARSFGGEIMLHGATRPEGNLGKDDRAFIPADLRVARTKSVEAPPTYLSKRTVMQLHWQLSLIGRLL